ncbi:hypothetical protein WME73_05760 [Sorangium sp. So ce302]|uniref:hypothetical protein n=1 Tax=Sorangium sp. So ce302 TaxID=3133297 RepID=UPI003F5F13E6
MFTPRWILSALFLTALSSTTGCVADTGESSANIDAEFPTLTTADADPDAEPEGYAISCRMAGTMTFNPPLTLSNTATTVSLSGTLSACVDATTNNIITGGAATATLTGTASKLTADLSGEVSLTYTLAGGGTLTHTQGVTCLVGAIGVYSCVGVVIDADGETAAEITPVVPATQFLGGPTSQVTFVDAGAAGVR